MTVLQSIEGKFYDIPDDRARSFEIPRGKVGDVLARVGEGPAPRGRPGRRRTGSDGPDGASRPGPVVVQIVSDRMHGSAYGRPVPAAAQAEREDDDVSFYGWNWPNYRGPWRWSNGWNNW